MVRRVPTTRLNSIAPSARPRGPSAGPRLRWLPGYDRHDRGGGVVAEEPAAVLGEGGPGPRHLPVAAPAAELVDALPSWPHPVAPIGCPFDSRPPLGFTGIRPPRAVSPLASSFGPSPAAHSPSSS